MKMFLEILVQCVLLLQVWVSGNPVDDNPSGNQIVSEEKTTQL